MVLNSLHSNTAEPSARDIFLLEGYMLLQSFLKGIMWAVGFNVSLDVFQEKNGQFNGGTSRICMYLLGWSTTLL